MTRALLDDYPNRAPVALSEHAYDRVSDRRTDEVWLAEVWGSAETRVLLLDGSSLLVPAGSAPGQTRAPTWVPPADAPAGERLLLGEQAGAARFAVLVDDVPGDLVGVPLRELLTEVATDDTAFALQAVALAEWHRAHRHCPRCGGELRLERSGHLKTCRDCGRSQFPRTDPAVIMLVTDGADRCLLGRQARWPEGRFSTLAGFVEPGETLEHAVAREVAEEVGVRVRGVDYFGNQPWPFPASLMVGFFARAEAGPLHVDGEEIAEARWLTREELVAEAESGRLLLPGSVSISRALIETWYGGALPGGW